MKSEVANNKETEWAGLRKTLWRIANDLRGRVDGWDFKTCELGMLFYRFISEPPLGRDEYSTTAPLIPLFSPRFGRCENLRIFP